MFGIQNLYGKVVAHKAAEAADKHLCVAVCNFCLQRSLQRHQFELEEMKGADVSAPASPVKAF